MNHPESKGILRNSQESQESGVLQWTIEKSGNGSFLEKLKKRSYIPSLIFDFILRS